VVKLVRVLHSQITRWYASLFGVHAAAEMVLDQDVTSRPEARMLMALAVPAIVEMNPLGASTWPTSSGNV
jgi:hypothetical protein